MSNKTNREIRAEEEAIKARVEAAAKKIEPQYNAC